MASLSEVYDRKHGVGHAEPSRVVLGVALFLAGAAMAVIGLVLASTEILSVWGVGRYETRHIAGILGGLGVPAVFVGILTVLPANQRLRIAAAMGAGVAVVGVALFAMVYPEQWLGARGVERHYTFETATIYFLGTLITFWCFFVGVVNFKTRNDPGGTVELEVRTAGRTRIVEVDKSIRSGLGGIGLFGSSSGPTASVSTTVSDGGSTSADITSPMDREDDGDILGDDEPAPVDRYCGNCRYFEYVRGASGMTPYCGYQKESMEDMEPCEEWAPNQL